MKKYKITVDNTVYDVVLEDVSISSTDEKNTQQMNNTHDSIIASEASDFSKANKKDLSVKNNIEGQITSPMPGSILAINISVGDYVKRGQVLIVLEAMKMENDIVSPVDGNVVSVNTSLGAAVNSGTLLCTIQ